MVQTKEGAPSLETQLDFLVHEMGTSNGGNVTSKFNPNMSSGDAAIAFEQHFERSGGSALNARINNARNVREAASNGTLSSISPNVATSYNYLVDQGFTPNQAAGIVGNLMAESGSSLNPNAYNPAGGGKGAWGIAQWRADRQDNLVGWDGTAIIPTETFTPPEELISDLSSEIPEIASAAEAALLEEQKQFINRQGQSLYEDNILNKFDSYIYNWAIHMVHPQFSQEFEKNLSRGTYVTLAQTGVENELSIEAVIQSSALNFLRQNRNAVANTFDITILEPQGFTFFNRILKAAKDLGIENYIEACYLLELRFSGWENGDPTQTTDIGPYYYMTTITQANTKHSDGASTYQLAFAETQLEAYNRLDYHLKADLSVQASTFGEFLTQFEIEMEKEVVKQTSVNLLELYPNIYKFGTTDSAASWKSWSFDSVSGNIDEGRNISMSQAAGKVKFEFKKGTAITSAIAAAILQTKEMKKLPVLDGTFAKETSNSVEAKPPKLAEMIKWFSFETLVEYKEFDPVKRQYQKQLTYNIRDYISPEGIHDPGSYAELIKNKGLQTKRLNNILKNGFLKKRFDYIYTGLNTEVLNLDLTFNNTFFALQPLNGGAIVRQGGYWDGIEQEERTAIEVKNSFASVRDKMNTNQRRLSQIETENEKLLGRRDLGDLERVRRLEAEKRQLQLQQIELVKNFERLRTEAEQATAELLERGGAITTKLSPLASNYLTQSELYNVDNNIDVISKSLNFDLRDVSDSLATSGSDDLGQEVGAAMLGALELNLNAVESMVNQRIEVRGDPYWLGRPKGVQSSDPTANQANYSQGGVGYFLHVRFPLYDGEDGFMSQNFTDFSITALFRVLRVTSMYSAGQFTQTLESFRDVNTNVPMMIEQLLSGKASGDVSTLSTSNFVDRDGDGVIDGVDQNGDGVVDNSERINPAARGGDFGSVSGDTNNVDNRLLSALDTAAQAAGVTAVVTSGHRADEDNPSGRHAGFAADTALYSNGRLLSVENPADLAIIQNYTRAYLDATRAAGLTPSIGIGNPAVASGSDLYMSGTSFHYDIARTPGIGASLSANAGPYWGGSGKRTGWHPAPQWLVDMYNS